MSDQRAGRKASALRTITLTRVKYEQGHRFIDKQTAAPQARCFPSTTPFTALASPMVNVIVTAGTKRMYAENSGIAAVTANRLDSGAERRFEKVSLEIPLPTQLSTVAVTLRRVILSAVEVTALTGAVELPCWQQRLSG